MIAPSAMIALARYFAVAVIMVVPFCVFGYMTSARDKPLEDRDAAIKALLEHFRNNIRINYGEVIGHTGSMTVNRNSGFSFMSEGPWLTCSSEIMVQLLATKFGEAKAFEPSSIP